MSHKSRKPIVRPQSSGTLISIAQAQKRNRRRPKPSSKTLARLTLFFPTNKSDRCMMKVRILRRLIKVELEGAAWEA